MKLFKRYIYKESQPLIDAGVRVRFIGDRLRLEPALVSLMDQLEQLTESNSVVNLTIAINYGGRDEVARATKRMAKDVLNGHIVLKYKRRNSAKIFRYTCSSRPRACY